MDERLWEIAMLLWLYLAAGTATAIVTMRIFPPMEGCRPQLRLRIFAVLVFVGLWPLLVYLAAWYFATGCSDRSKHHVDHVGEPQMGVDFGTNLRQGVPPSKPH